MLISADLPAPLSFAVYVIAFIAAALFLLRAAASRYFVVDAPFDPADPYHQTTMSIGGEGGPRGSCSVCQRASTKKCAGCKSVYYCSQACQSKHWGEHKSQCKKLNLSDKADVVSSESSACRRRKSSGSSSIMLVPMRGKSKALQEPKKFLFPYDEFVKLFNWDDPGFSPCGLINCGNSCFANVVLQCLASTRPLVAYLLDRDHSNGCIRRQNDWCFLCELQVHVRRASKSWSPFSPINILSRLPNIGGNLGYGRQEDAHEFMRFAIDTMQSVCLDEFGGEKALDISTQETTLIHHIFGGQLQSQVICTKCNAISNRYESMMDLTVEIQGDAESLEDCLDQFTMKEWLDGENMYKCDGCNSYVKACKRLTVHQAPNILTIALKRFQSGRFGKLNKRITFPENLDLTPYMSGNEDGSDIYSLYAVVVHVDMLNASFFGHYICYTKDYHGHWYRIDDCKVLHVELEEVLAEGAYMLLYSRRNARRQPFIKPMEPARKKLVVGVDSSVSNISKMTTSAGCLPSNTGSLLNHLASEIPIDAPFHRDIGHERSSFLEAKSVKEKASQDMDLEMPSEVSGNVDMFNSEPNLMGPKGLLNSSVSPQLPKDISSVMSMRSNSIPPDGISCTGVQDMDCEEPCISSDSDIYTEQDSGPTKTIDEKLKQSKYTPEDMSGKSIEYKKSGTSSNGSIATTSVVESVCSDADGCTEQDAESIRTESFNLLKSAVENSFTVEEVVRTPGEASSGASETSYASAQDAISMLEPVDVLRTDLEVAPDCCQLDSANRVNRLDPVSCRGEKRITVASCCENGRSSMECIDHGGVQPDCDSAALASKSNVNGHVECDLPDPNFCKSIACLELLSGNRKGNLPCSGIPLISQSMLDKSGKQIMDSISTTEFNHQNDHSNRSNCDGFLEPYPSEQNVSDSDASPQVLSANDNDILPGTGTSSLSRNISNPLYQEPINVESTGMGADHNGSPVLNSAELDSSEYCDNGANKYLLFKNGKGTHPGSNKPFLSSGFLNKSKSRNGVVSSRKELDRTNHLCGTDRNRSALDSVRPDFSEQSASNTDTNVKLLSANGNQTLPGSGPALVSCGSPNKLCMKLISDEKFATENLGKPFLSRGFLNKSKSRKEVMSCGKEQGITNHLWRDNCNGSASVEVDSDQSASSTSDDNESADLSFSENSACDNGIAQKLVPANGKHIKPFISPGFLDRHYMNSVNEDRLASKKLEEAERFAGLAFNPKGPSKDFGLETSIESDGRGTSDGVLANGNGSILHEKDVTVAPAPHIDNDEALFQYSKSGLVSID